jgi:hypothetical protein
MNDAYAPGAGSARDDDVKWNVVVDVDHAMLVAKRESSIWMIDESAFDAAVRNATASIRVCYVQT